MQTTVPEGLALPNGEATRYTEYTVYDEDDCCIHQWETSSAGTERCTKCDALRLLTGRWIEGVTRVATLPDMRTEQDLGSLTENCLVGKAFITSMEMEIPPKFPTAAEEKWPVIVNWKTVG